MLKVGGVKFVCESLSYARVCTINNKNKNSRFSQVMGVYLVFVAFVNQLCSPSDVCVCSLDTCVYTKLTFHPNHAWHSCSLSTALWCGCSFVKFTYYL